MHRLPGQWKLYMETSACSGTALDADGAAVLAHDTVRHREAQASSFPGTFGCEKRIIDALQMLGRDALPAISYFDAGEPLFVPSANRQRTAGLHGVARVQEQIQKYLLQFAGIRLHARQTRFQAQLHMDVRFLQLVLDQCQSLPDHL